MSYCILKDEIGVAFTSANHPQSSAHIPIHEKDLEENESDYE